METLLAAMLYLNLIVPGKYTSEQINKIEATNTYRIDQVIISGESRYIDPDYVKNTDNTIIILEPKTVWDTEEF